MIQTIEEFLGARTRDAANSVGGISEIPTEDEQIELKRVYLSAHGVPVEGLPIEAIIQAYDMEIGPLLAKPEPQKVGEVALGDVE